MNAVSDSLLNRADDKAEATGQEQKTELDAQLVEMGKVSETRGGWWGSKFDSGLGVLFY